MMHLTKALLAISAAAVVAITPTAIGQDQGRICHIANAGFFFERNDIGVVVDAVLQRDDYKQTFALPSATVLSEITAGAGPFSNVKLALVSHKHGDHFDARASLRHLRATNVTYIVPPEVLALLKGAGLKSEEEGRVKSYLPQWGAGPAIYKGDGFDVEIYRVDHGVNMPQNLGFRATIDGVSFFHTGDINASAERLKQAGLNKTPVDYMLMPFWYSLQNMPAIEAAWQIQTMVAMHYHAKAQPWMTQYGGPEGIRRIIKEAWPKSLSLDREMQCSVIAD